MQFAPALIACSVYLQTTKSHATLTCAPNLATTPDADRAQIIRRTRASQTPVGDQ